MSLESDPDLLLLQAIAHPARLAILRRLSTRGPTVASGLNGCCEVGQSTVSHHLKVLLEAGWVTAERRGSWMWYSIRDAAPDQLRRFAERVRPNHAIMPPGSTAPVRFAPAPEGRRPPGVEDDWRQW